MAIKKSPTSKAAAMKKRLESLYKELSTPTKKGSKSLGTTLSSDFTASGKNRARLQKEFNELSKEYKKIRGGAESTRKAAPALKTSPTKKKMSFGEAFAAARRAGKKTFQFTKANGKTETFTTETREEEAARKAKAAKKESMAKKKETLKKTVERSGAESRKLADKKRRRKAGKYVGPRQRMVDRLERERREKKKAAKRKTGSSMKPKGVGVAMRGYGGAMKK